MYSSIFWSHGFIDPGGGLCSFWYDYWIPGVRFSTLYPRIAATSRSLDSFVSDLCSFHDSRSWIVPLPVNLRGGAAEEWLRFSDHLNSTPVDLITAGPPYIVWSLESSGAFSVKFLRSAISAQRFPGIDGVPHDVLWPHFIPTKIQCFTWMVFHKRIATIDNLQRRGFHLAGRCVLCSNQSESVDLIFLHCDFAAAIWRRLS
ncbi:Putative ribonuclease H protein At1g65750 [Linum grandiflorum]